MKTNLTDQQLQQIIDLFNQDYGSRKIAEIMKVNRSTIIRAYKQLKLDSNLKKTPRFAYKTIEKCCKICLLIKPINQFRTRKNGDRVSFECYCLDCEKQLNNERLKLHAKILRQTEPNFRIRKSLSYSIWKTLKQLNSSKNNEKCIDYLSYTIEELKQYLEVLFEPWMTWDNYGSYKKSTWDDNDSSTWTWNIDHIIPQSDLPYISMEDENFNKCWTLSNLRPLSSKQNLLDGVNKNRHNK